MDFWKLAFEQKWVDTEQLKGAVKTEKFPFGEITPAQYKEITNIYFEVE
ncbi:XkdX family protein [Clostridium botulinum]|nr:XkdX family protein [Clostridium botulinum]AWB30061.1 XkdX family protein [Clostridium botulinum]MBY6830673.1 XkdX family protein [Clostridium botulinum]MBY6923938.1 XkdX family protein [Clostridium botulinum]MBY6940397.1 XkdX family protein [Clostridium botulinum]MBY6961204.1 XkdX family protein [Clostridium botulinum]